MKQQALNGKWMNLIDAVIARQAFRTVDENGKETLWVPTEPRKMQYPDVQ